MTGLAIFYMTFFMYVRIDLGMKGVSILSVSGVLRRIKLFFYFFKFLSYYTYYYRNKFLFLHKKKDFFSQFCFNKIRINWLINSIYKFDFKARVISNLYKKYY